ncbi:unnamed protein product [Caenorhabditis brenneri]
MISICGIVARVVLFFFCDSSELVQFYLFLTFNALSIRFYIPVLLSRKYSTLPYTKNGSIIVWITAILFVALLIFLFIAAGYPKSFNEIMIFQLYYSFFTASYIDYKIYSIVTIEDYNELRAQVYQYVSVLLVRERPAPPPRPSFSDVVRIHSSPGEPAPKCQVCFLPFSAQVIPRILTTCAHTLCQNCIGRIMDENDRVCCPVCQEVTVVYASLSGVATIQTSGIARIYYERLGFVDFGKGEGLRKLLTRIFYLFPIGSVICYIVLLYHFHKEKLGKLNKSHKRQGEHKVFVQLLITISFYGIMSLVSEIMELIEWFGHYDIQLTLIALFNVFSYLPEISLPLAKGLILGKKPMYYSEDKSLINSIGGHGLNCETVWLPGKLPTENPDCQEIDTKLHYFSWQIIGLNVICILNFVTQLVTLYMILVKKKFQKGSFFTLVVNLSSNVIFRSLTFLATTIIAANFNSTTTIYKIATYFSLYVDNFSNNFSLIIIFLMSLNRCLLFVKVKWNSVFFYGNRTYLSIFVSAILAVSSGTATILTSQIGSFFIFLVVLALSVIFRTVTSLGCNIIGSSVPSNSMTYKISLDVPLYVDYCSGYFSMILIFLMSLNRCLCFVNRQWIDTFFEGKRILDPIFVSLLLSVLSSIACITTRGISRSYDSSVGFIDIGAPKGLKNLITRLYHLFPNGSIICYVALFYHLRLKKLQKTKNQNNKGEQKVFIQLLVTIVFYGIMAILTELLAVIQLDYLLQTVLIAILNCVNFLPEITLPFLLICSNLKPKRRVSVFVATSRTQSQTKMSAKGV